MMQVSYDQLYDAIRAEIPTFEVRYKDTSRWMRLFGAILFFNPAFMSRYVTTFRGKVYVPSAEWLMANRESFTAILAHEYIHLADARRLPVLFESSYVFPQILALGALGALGAFWSLSWLWCLLFLVFLAPWPAPWRAHWERRGYGMTLLWRVQVEGRHLPSPDPTDPLVEWLTDQFAGWSYYRMGTRSGALRWYTDTAHRAVSGQGWDEPYHTLLRRLGVWHG